MAYQIIIADEVFTALNSIIFYLENKFSKKVAAHFLLIFYKKAESLSDNPNLGRKISEHATIRRILITKHNLLYYEVVGNQIHLLSIFFTVQNPKKNKFE